MPQPTSPTAILSSARPRRDRPSRPAVTQGPRSTSATASAAAVAQNEGFKPREERGWEEFHPDLEIDAEFPIFGADEVDGISPPETKVSTPNNGLGQYAVENGASALLDEAVRAQQETPCMTAESPSFPVMDGDTVTVNVNVASVNGSLVTPAKRRPGRPSRRTDAMLYGLGSPPVPRITPAPTRDPKERLNLQKPVYRQVDSFASYEQDQSVQVNYVDRAMAAIGYQESDVFFRSEKHCIRVAEGSIEEDLDLALKSDGDNAASHLAVSRVEYDMDEQDDRWLDAYNVQRRDEGVEPIKPAIFEITITQIEKEWHALEKRTSNQKLYSNMLANNY
jgi:NuA3 HAT complex component NTO1